MCNPTTFRRAHPGSNRPPSLRCIMFFPPLSQELAVHRVWDPLAHPKWLVFEADGGLQVRSLHNLPTVQPPGKGGRQQ